MPRRRRTEQATEVANNLPFGNRNDLQEAQAAIPLPQRRIPGEGVVSETPPPSGGPDVSPPAAPPADPLAAAAAQPFAPVGIFGPSERPDEPPTAGLPFGPGPGPQGLAPVRTDPAIVAMRRAMASVPETPLSRRIREILG